MSTFVGHIFFEGERVQIAQLRDRGFISEAQASAKPNYIFYVKNRPISIQFFSEIEVPNLWSPGTEITQLFSYTVAMQDTEGSFSMSDPFPLKLTTKEPDGIYCSIAYKADMDINKPGMRQFRTKVILEDGTVLEHLFPKFYLID